MRKLRFAFGGLALTAAVAFWIGCGSSSDNSLIAGGDDGGAEATTTPPPPPAPPPPPPGDAGDAGDLPDGAVVADGGRGVQDAGPGGTTSSLNCGTATCAIPSQSCCVSTGGGGGTGFLCVVGPGSNCPGAGNGGNGPDVIALKCSSSANCAAGEQCCANIGAGGVVESACVPWGTCTAGDGGQEHAVLCNGDAGTNGCDAGVNCSNNNIGDWGLPQSFATCGGRGGPF